MEPSELERVARQIRLRDLQAVYEAGAGHIGGEMSVIDLLTALYFRVLRVWPDQPRHPDRDRFVLEGPYGLRALCHARQARFHSGRGNLDFPEAAFPSERPPEL